MVIAACPILIMINIRLHDTSTYCAISIKDEGQSGSALMTIRNIQSKAEISAQINEVGALSRYFTARFFLVGNWGAFSTQHGEDNLSALVSNGTVTIGDTCYLYLPDGMYEYSCGGEVGLVRIGKASDIGLQYNNATNDVVYNG